MKLAIFKFVSPLWRGFLAIVSSVLDELGVGKTEMSSEWRSGLVLGPTSFDNAKKLVVLRDVYHTPH